MMNTFLVCAFVCVMAMCSTPGGHPVYDHQKQTYEGRFTPLSLENYGPLTITPFFSPKESVKEELEMIESAKEKIDVMIPGVSSWAHPSCSYEEPPDQCVGCFPSFLREKETFPLFQALLNAIHRGVKVRILTNDYEEPICPGKMTTLTFLQAAGASVKYFATVSFLHNKYMCVDGKYVIISSINYSKNAFLRNREAGVVFDDESNGKIVEYLNGQVFEYDFERGYDIPLPHFDSDDMRIVNNQTQIPVVFPKGEWFPYYVDVDIAPIPLSEVDSLEFYISPEYAHDVVLEGLDSVQQALVIYMYQITDESIQNKLIELHERGVEIQLLVSCAIFGEEDRKAAFQVYQKLLDAGINIKMPKERCFAFSHQKFWIIDGKTVFLSSGNWSPSDLPLPPYTFPSFNAINDQQEQEQWRKTNRDMNVKMNAGPQVVYAFKKVFGIDYYHAQEYNGSNDFLSKTTCRSY